MTHFSKWQFLTVATLPPDLAAEVQQSILETWYNFVVYSPHVVSLHVLTLVTLIDFFVNLEHPMIETLELGIT
jgi:hypothetical protein